MIDLFRLILLVATRIRLQVTGNDGSDETRTRTGDRDVGVGERGNLFTGAKN